jgi:chemotaxis protein MotB
MLLLAGLSVAISACTSPEQYRAAIDERDAEISQLREERARLKEDRQRLQADLDATSAQLREASLRAQRQPEVIEVPAKDDTGLEALGVGYAYRDGVAVITIPQQISFPSGSATLSAKGREALKEVAQVLRSRHADGTYSIEGHTDTDPISKSKFGSNRDLSLARAMAVLTELVEGCGISDDRCVVVGHSQYRPVDPGSSPEAKARNRRVEILVFDGAR